MTSLNAPLRLVFYGLLSSAYSSDRPERLFVSTWICSSASFLCVFQIPVSTNDAECLRAYSLLWSNLATHVESHASLCSENAFETVATRLIASELRDVQMNAISAALKVSGLTPLSRPLFLRLLFISSYVLVSLSPSSLSSSLSLSLPLFL